MIDSFFQFLKGIETFFWGYIAFILIIVLGSYLTMKNAFFQVRQVPAIIKYFIQLIGKSTKGERGVHPLKTFFASVGGMVGVGNIAGVVTAVELGGPGALFWVWVTGMIGAIVKYSEIYLGVKYRVENANGGYDGGPMYFLRHAFPSKFLPILVAALLCIYGVEIYQFSVITESVSTNWHVNRHLVALLLLGAILYASFGGVKRVGQICSWVMPIFILVFLGMGVWILAHEITQVPAIFGMVLKSAFTGHAAVGGFAGATAMLAIQYGVARAAYSSDIAIGYDSILQSESSNKHPQKQARLAILGVLIDNMISTLSIVIVLVSGVWMAEVPIPGSHLVQVALSNYFPYMHLFMPVCLAIVGFTTIIAFFCVGIKCAKYLFPRIGMPIYAVYGAFSLLLSSFIDQAQTMLVMSIAGALLLIINLLGIFKLRREISFIIPDEEPLVLKKKAIKTPIS